MVPRILFDMLGWFFRRSGATCPATTSVLILFFIIKVGPESLRHYVEKSLESCSVCCVGSSSSGGYLSSHHRRDYLEYYSGPRELASLWYVELVLHHQGAICPATTGVLVSTSVGPESVITE